MTIEEKAKAYDEALEKAKTHINSKGVGDTVDLCKHLFSELREDEDERIRRNIIGYIQERIDEFPGDVKLVKRWKKEIAWLEKQKDILSERARNITANMLEDGIEGIQHELIEFLSNTINAPWVDIIKSADAYAQRIRSMVKKQKESLHISKTCKENADYFTDEDERIRKELIGMVKFHCPDEYLDRYLNWLEKQKERRPIINISHLKSLMLQYLQEAANENDDSDIQADTEKWARKILGYDFEQKPHFDAHWENVSMAFDLKEQKPAGWSEEDKEMLQGCINSVEYELLDNGMDDEVKTDPRIAWLNSLPGRFNLQPEQEWSDRDEEILEFVLGLLDNLVWRRDWEISQAECLEWLVKSLNPTKKEWGEEDEKMRINILNALTPQLVYSVGKGTCTGTSTYKYDDEIKWLKSLRLQPHWKPSEEQMEALERTIRLANFGLEENRRKALESLYDQLKKLI